MDKRITSISLGFDQCYLIQADGLIAVDAGVRGKGGKLLRSMEQAGLSPEDLRLIVLTHGHWDHIGGAREIKEATGARIAMHQREAGWLEGSEISLSPGVTAWGRVFASVMKLFMPMVRIPPAEVDLKLGDEDFPLKGFGVNGRVVHTPGHTWGSVSVLLDSGEAFVGDLAMNRLPLRWTPGLPIFAQDEAMIRESWKRLLKKGAEWIYPAHGRPFPASVMERLL